MKEYTVKDLIEILKSVNPTCIVTIEDTVLSRDGLTENNVLEDIVVVDGDYYDLNGNKRKGKIVVLK